MLRMVRAGAAAVAAFLLLSGCGTSTTSHNEDDSPRIVRVPEDADSAQAGADLLRPGDMLLLGEGTYHEELVVRTPDVTIRGVDRNRVVFDGEGELSQGVLVVADGVRVQNLTAHSYLYNGVLITGLHDGSDASAHGLGAYEQLNPQEYPPLQRFAIEHVTAYNNGLYGLYAFNAQHGRITDSYASGSADSGIYVGQCEDCDVIVADNIAEGNAIGFENANASGPLTVVGNRFSNNRVGMTLISNHQEAFSPQRENVVAGNVVVANANPETPAQADGAFGIGIGISGGHDNKLYANRIESHPFAGVLMRNTEDIATEGSQLDLNTFGRNAVDVADISADYAPASRNCVVPAEGLRILPKSLGEEGCAAAETIAVVLGQGDAPKGRSFLALPAPPEQPQMLSINDLPAPLPAMIEHPDVAELTVPDPGLLREWSRK